LLQALTVERCQILEEKAISMHLINFSLPHVGCSTAISLAVADDRSKRLLNNLWTVLSQGFIVVDGVCGSAWATALRQEMEWLMDAGHMLPNKTQFNTAEGPKQFSKPHIFEVDLHDPEIPWPHLPEFKALREACPLAKAFQTRKIPVAQGINGTALKLQCNLGSGGCFPLHYDNPGVPNMRKLTALVYLNPGWAEGDGGELILQPFLRERILIPPLMDRMVVFRSDSMLHSVAPSHARRYCFTAWLDSELGYVNQPEDLNLKVKHLDMIKSDPLRAIDWLASSPIQRVLSRAVYHEEYERSLISCMQEAPGCDLMLASHYDHMSNHRDGNQELVDCVVALRGVAMASRPPCRMHGGGQAMGQGGRVWKTEAIRKQGEGEERAEMGGGSIDDEVPPQGGSGTKEAARGGTEPADDDDDDEEDDDSSSSSSMGGMVMLDRSLEGDAFLDFLDETGPIRPIVVMGASRGEAPPAVIERGDRRHEEKAATGGARQELTATSSSLPAGLCGLPSRAFLPLGDPGYDRELFGVSLEEQGYCVIDNAMSPSWAAALAHEIQSLYAMGVLGSSGNLLSCKSETGPHSGQQGGGVI